MTGIVPDEQMVPLLQTTDADATVAFWTSLGFEVTWDQRRPYLYLAFRWSGIDLHYGQASPSVDPEVENTGGALVMVGDVAAYHAAFAAAMRAAHGKVLAKGRPRITRYRAGASRFSLVDPSGNTVIVIQRDEPAELEYGGSRDLVGLARALDNARVLREFKTDDLAAYRALVSGWRRHGDDGSVVERALVLAGLVELATALGEPDRVAEWGGLLSGLELGADERARVVASVADAEVLTPWLRG